MMNFEHTKIDSNDIKKASLRYMFGGQLGWNYEKMMNIAYLRAILPAMEKMYGNDKHVLAEMLKMEAQFYNTSPFFSAVIIGIDLALQNEDGVAAKEAVASIKMGMMGPFAAVGDSLFGAIIPTIFGSIAAYMGIKGNPLGVIMWILVAVIILGLRYFELPFAYHQGKKMIFGVGDLLNNLTDAATLMGVLVIGGLIPTVVKVIVPFKFKINGKAFSIQSELFDQLLPALVPCILVLIAYLLLKKLNSTQVIWLFLFGSIILSSIGFLAVDK